MNDKVSWVIELKIKEGQLEAYKTLMEEMVNSTKEAEEGTLNYEWYISEDESSSHIYESYKDSDAVMVHLVSFGMKYAEPMMALVEVTGFTIYGNPSDMVRSTLAQFNPVILSAIGGFSR